MEDWIDSWSGVRYKLIEGDVKFLDEHNQWQGFLTKVPLIQRIKYLESERDEARREAAENEKNRAAWEARFFGSQEILATFQGYLNLAGYGQDPEGIKEMAKHLAGQEEEVARLRAGAMIGDEKTKHLKNMQRHFDEKIETLSAVATAHSKDLSELRQGQEGIDRRLTNTGQHLSQILETSISLARRLDELEPAVSQIGIEVQRLGDGWVLERLAALEAQSAQTSAEGWQSPEGISRRSKPLGQVQFPAEHPVGSHAAGMVTEAEEIERCHKAGVEAMMEETERIAASLKAGQWLDYRTPEPPEMVAACGGVSEFLRSGPDLPELVAVAGAEFPEVAEVERIIAEGIKPGAPVRIPGPDLAASGPVRAIVERAVAAERERCAAIIADQVRYSPPNSAMEIILRGLREEIVSGQGAQKPAQEPGS